MKLKQITNNFHVVEAKHFHVYFSYETPIAYRLNYDEHVTISENIWTRTTGKHINWIKNDIGEYKQIPNDEFVDKLNINL